MWTSAHGIFSRKEMADSINKGIDYPRLMKTAKSTSKIKDDHQDD